MVYKDLNLWYNRSKKKIPDHWKLNSEINNIEVLNTARAESRFSFLLSK